MEITQKELIDLVEEELMWYWKRGEKPKFLEALVHPRLLTHLVALAEEYRWPGAYKSFEMNVAIFNTPHCTLRLIRGPHEAFEKGDTPIKFIRARDNNEQQECSKDETS